MHAVTVVLDFIDIHPGGPGLRGGNLDRVNLGVYDR